MNEHNIMSLLLLHDTLFTFLNIEHDGEHLKGKAYDSKIKCIVMVYNLFQPLFFHFITYKFHSYDLNV